MLDLGYDRRTVQLLEPRDPTMWTVETGFLHSFGLSQELVLNFPSLLSEITIRISVGVCASKGRGCWAIWDSNRVTLLEKDMDWS